MENKPVPRVMELYSGIGGMHYSFLHSGIPHKVVAAVDINTTANSVYHFNFPTTKHLQRNIQSLSLKEFDSFAPDILTMSPPCQPFTRVGLKQDCKDLRTESLFHILNLLPDLRSVSYILLENVCGFEVSKTREQIINVLKESGFILQEFLLSPKQLGIPNSRLRYYLLAKKKPKRFCFQENPKILDALPITECCFNETLEDKRRIKDYLEPDLSDKYLLPDKVLERFCQILDIVDETSTQSCCFTKGYSHYVEGTGSVIHGNLNHKISDVYKEMEDVSDTKERLGLVQKLGLRYFTPREVSNLMGFPVETSVNPFCFPENITDKQRYRVLGNSVNVKVISKLLKILLCDKKDGL